MVDTNSVHYKYFPLYFCVLIDPVQPVHCTLSTTSLYYTGQISHNIGPSSSYYTSKVINGIYERFLKTSQSPSRNKTTLKH